MTYRIYLKNDYKSEVRWGRNNPTRSFFFRAVCYVSLIVSGYYFLFINSPFKTEQALMTMSITPVIDNQVIALEKNPVLTNPIEENTEYFTTIDFSELSNQKLEKTSENEAKILWQSVVVKPGDSLALIFSRLGLSSSSLFQIMSLGKETSILKTLIPGDKLKFNIVNNELLGLNYEMDLTKILKISKKDNKFSTEKIAIKLDSVVKNATGIINDSLFLSGQKTGLSDNLIMQLVAIFGWDIDFVLDIRKGDSFTVIYEEQYKEGTKVIEGPIVAAEFVNKGKVLRAVRYSENNERNDYYAVNGDAMRKAFLRTPIDFFSRISSRFNFGRKHPILNKIRAHRGVDYAAPTGTPVKATGDGVITYAGKNGGFGRTIKLKHGGTYSTVYAHLRRFAKNMRSGKKVKQGQIIAYVGRSGLATGPHLHYEFQIHGVHRNPLTVKLPKVKAITKKNLPEFKKTTIPVLAELDRITGKSILSAQQSNPPAEELGLKVDDS